MTIPTATNTAQDHAHVGVQAETVHQVNFYQVPPDATPEERFRAGVKYLEAGVRDEAQRLIEEAVTHGYQTTEVQFHRLIAVLGGRTLRQLDGAELDRLAAICASLPRLDQSDEWAAGLKAIVRLLAPVGDDETEVVVKEIDALDRRQRDWIYGHLEALLEGALQDEMWQRSVSRAATHRTAGDRLDRVWKFFHPKPAQPRTPEVRAAAIPLRDRIRAVAGAAAFLLAVGELAVLLAGRGQAGPILGLVAGVAGLGAYGVAGAERHYRRARVRAKDARLRPPIHWRADAPAGGFARKVDGLFDRYFRRYVPAGTERSYWLSQTAGIRRHLRDETVDLYRERRIDAERIAWLIRHLVSDVRQQWESDTLTAYRYQLRIPVTTTILYLGGVVALAVGSLWVVPAAVLAAPLSGTAWLLLTIAAATVATRSLFRIVAERRRVGADLAERAAEEAARWSAYHRWQQKLSDKPSDTEMASWLESDRKILVDQAMHQYRLRPSQVIAHAFIEAPGGSCKRARYPSGPWRYSRYRLLLFLLTDDGVRQVDIDLDFEHSTSRTTQRLNYRFDAVAAVRVSGMAARRHTFELTLFNGDPVSVTVAEAHLATVEGDDQTRITELSLDASGLHQTLHVLEGIAAEGKEWVRHRRRRASERLDDLAGTVRGLIG